MRTPGKLSVITVGLVACCSSASLRAQSDDAAELQQMKATMQEMAKTIKILQKRVAELEEKQAVKKEQAAAHDLDGVANEHHASFRHGIGESPDKRRENYIK